MPMERLPMRRVRDCLKLNSAGIPTREIARRLSIAPSTVRLTLRRCADAGVVWPVAEDVTDAALEQSLFANSRTKQGCRRHEEPDWPTLNNRHFSTSYSELACRHRRSNLCRRHSGPPHTQRPSYRAHRRKLTANENKTTEISLTKTRS